MVVPCIAAEFLEAAACVAGWWWSKKTGPSLRWFLAMRCWWCVTGTDGFSQSPGVLNSWNHHEIPTFVCFCWSKPKNSQVVDGLLVVGRLQTSCLTTDLSATSFDWLGPMMGYQCWAEKNMVQNWQVSSLDGQKVTICDLCGIFLRRNAAFSFGQSTWWLNPSPSQNFMHSVFLSMRQSVSTSIENPHATVFGAWK